MSWTRIYFGQGPQDQGYNVLHVFIFSEDCGILKTMYLDCQWGQPHMIQLDLFECVYAVLFSEPSLIKNLPLRDISFAALKY